MNPGSIQNKYLRHARIQMITLLCVSILLALSILFRKHLPHDLFGYCGIAGMIYYVFLGLRKFGLSIFNPGLAKQVEDERHRQNVLQAQALAFRAMCFAIFVVLGFRKRFQDAPDGTEAMVILAWSMGTFAVASLFLDSEEN